MELLTIKLGDCEDNIKNLLVEGPFITVAEAADRTYSEFSDNASATYQTQIFCQSASSKQADYNDKSWCLGESGMTDKQGKQTLPSSAKSSVRGSDDETVDPYQAEYHPQKFSLAV